VQKHLNCRVLVIDDSKMINSAVIQISSDAGAISTGSISPLEGIELVDSFGPDFIVVDYEMPEMTGLEFIAKIRGHKKYDTIPILMLTGIDSEKLAFDAIKAGADDFIDKSNLTKLLVPKLLALSRIRLKNLEMAKVQRLEDFASLVATVQHEVGNSVAKLSGHAFKMLRSTDSEREISYGKIQEEVASVRLILNKVEALLDLETEDYPGGAKKFKVR
jgi:DNA-binding response OmpR family regulator